jgi:rare lipoprotein A
MRRRILTQSMLAAMLVVSTLGSAPSQPDRPPKLDTRKVVEPAKPYQVGKASWYGELFHGKITASGETFDMNQLTAAHPELPLGSYVRVTNLSNGRSIVVRINDRGPITPGRIIDLSYKAAEVLRFNGKGLQKVRLDLVRQPVS